MWSPFFSMFIHHLYRHHQKLGFFPGDALSCLNFGFLVVLPLSKMPALLDSCFESWFLLFSILFSFLQHLLKFIFISELFRLFRSFIFWQTLIWSSCFEACQWITSVLNPLYFLWWSFHWIDTDMPPFLKVFLIWPAVVKGFFSSPGKEVCHLRQLFSGFFWAFESRCAVCLFKAVPNRDFSV